MKKKGKKRVRKKVRKEKLLDTEKPVSLQKASSFWEGLKAFFRFATKEKSEKKVSLTSVTLQRYETGIDALYRLVLQKEKLSLTEAEQALKISAEICREWASILEHKGFIAIKYPAFGEITLLKPLPKEEPA